MQDQYSEGNSPRKPLFAALMSAALPGLGQLYNGEFNKAIWVFLLFSLAAVPLIVIIALLLPSALTLPLVVIATAFTIGIWIYSIINAWRNATHRQNFQTRIWQTSGVYTLVFLVCATVILPSTIMWTRKHWVEPFQTPSASMEPTVLKGDFFFAEKSYNCPTCLKKVKRGDVALFVYPNNRNLHYIKRVIALPGDEVTLEGTTLTINGERLNTDAEPETESYDGNTWRVQWSGEASNERIEITVKPGHAFVLGDNRFRSNDSRLFGQVPLADIVGKARQVWFSKSPEGIRWSRIGHMLN